MPSAPAPGHLPGWQQEFATSTQSPPGGDNRYGWRQLHGDRQATGETSLLKLCKDTGKAPGRSPQRDTFCPLPPTPHPRSVQGWMHEGAQLTEIQQWKPDSWRAGRNPRAAFRGFAPAQSTKGPHKGQNQPVAIRAPQRAASTPHTI